MGIIERISWLWKKAAWVIVILAIALAFSGLVWGAWNAHQLKNLSQDIQSTISSHNSELVTINANVKEIKRLQDEHASDLQAITALEKDIETSAQQIEGVNEKNHNQSLDELYLICAQLKIQGCTLP